MSHRAARGRHRAARPRPIPTRTDGRGRHARPRARRPLVVVIATVLLLAAGGGAAVASWVASGQGAAGSKAIAARDVVIAAATPAAELYPGGTGSVRLTVSNPNPYPVRLTHASFGQVTASPVSGRTCAATGVEVVSSGPVAMGTAVDLPAGSGPVTVTLTNALRMRTDADNGCQDASFSVPVTLTGTST